MATRDINQSRWFSGDSRHYQGHNYKHYYKYLVGLCAVVFALPAYAENTSVSANPQAAITGSVANQAVQINQGSLSSQAFGSGIVCNGPVISVTPYVMGTENYGNIYSSSNNFGVQVSMSMPLDGGSVERCKALAQIQIDKGRLDYELVRVKECINIFKQGFMIRPESPFYVVCADVVPLPVREPTLAEASSP